jgi:NhaP-type Na+/H+ or K+/H+ antiporter
MDASAVLTLGVLSLAYATLSARLDRTSITGPMVFTVAGLVAGPHVLGLVDVSLHSEGFVTLAELALTLLLFTSASRLDVGALRRGRGLPVRLLGIGLPLTMVLGTLAAVLVLPSLVFWEAAVLAVVLAPTDAALGQAVISDRRVPAFIRRSLDAESGLNDGLALPFLTMAIAFAHDETGDGTLGHWVWFTVKTIGISLLVGAAIGYVGGRLLELARSRGTMSDHWAELGVLVLAVVSFVAVDRLDGSGFVGAFVAGIATGAVAPAIAAKRETTTGALGDLLVLLVFALFGAEAVWPAFEHVDWTVLLYAAISLTLVRMIPVAISLAGAGFARATALYIGWFGPRGTASVIFALVVVEEATLPHTSLIVQVVAVTVASSILVHGVTAHRGAAVYAAAIQRVRRRAPDAPELADA